MKRILCSLLVATLPFGSVLADTSTEKNVKVTLVYEHELPNVPGKSLRAVLVEYGPGGGSPSHRHPSSAFIYLIIPVTHPAMMTRYGCGAVRRAGVGEALGQGVELVAAIEAPGEAGEVALGVLGADVMVGAGERVLMLPSAVLTQVRATWPACEPVTIGKGRSRLHDRRQQDRPSVTTLLPAARSRLASARISFLRKPLTTLSRSRRGLRSAVVSTAGDDRRLAGGTAAALAARALAAEIGVVDLDPARELGLLGLARGHRPHQLVLDQPGCLPLDPEPPRELDELIPLLPCARW